MKYAKNKATPRQLLDAAESLLVLGSRENINRAHDFLDVHEP